jgi:SOS-response transcriptional repressor LexA
MRGAQNYKAGPWNVSIYDQNKMHVSHDDETKVFEIEWDNPDKEGMPYFRLTSEGIEERYQKEGDLRASPYSVRDPEEDLIINVDNDDHLSISIQGEYILVP